MLVDYHLHSNYSADGEVRIMNICKKAIEMGIEEIAITDHIDIDWPDPDLVFDISDLDAYIEDIKSCQYMFRESIKVRKGIEVGLQPHVLKDTEDLVKSYPFDFVIGAIHILEGMDPYNGHYYKGKTKEKSYEIYYNTILDLIKSYDHFDVLGHLSYIKRYSPLPYDVKDELICLDIIEDILKILIEKGKGIEVNTSGYAHVSNTPMPSFPIIKRFRELGGEIITIGSDAHKIERIGYGISKGISMIKEAGFKYITTFERRNPIFKSI